MNTNMSGVFRKAAYLLAFWMLYWYVGKLLFLAYQWAKASSLDAGELVQAYWYGSRLDLSMSSYFVALYFLISGLLFFSPRVSAAVSGWVQYIGIVLSSVLVFANLELYRNWGFHIDTTPLLYIGTPKEMMASVPVLRTLALIAGAAAWSAAGIYLFRKYIHGPAPALRWYWSPALIVCAAAMFVPIRGGIGIVPVNAGSGYFSEKMFANHLTVNPVWNFQYSLSKLDDLADVHEYMADSTARRIASGLRYPLQPSSAVLRMQRPNIVFIVLESFTAKLVASCGGEPDVTPQLNALAREGVLFSNMYATADRSDKGLVAIFSGVPALPTLSMNKFPQKTQRFSSLVRKYTEQGYSSAFYYGGNVNFANLKSYLMNAGFGSFITIDDFSAADCNAKWGVHDHLMFQRYAADLASARTPFIRALFTLSSHEPYDVPLEPARFSGTETDQFRNSVYYADSCLGAFFRTVKQLPLWDSTLFIVVADHGSRHPGDSELSDPAKYRIPMLWLGGALASPPGEMRKLCGQVDIAASLLCQTGMPADDFLFSNNFFSSSYPGTAFYSYNNGWGYMDSTLTQIRDNRSGVYSRRTGSATADDSVKGLAYLQNIWLYFKDK